MQLTDKKKGILLALFGVLLITPDSLFIRLTNISSWELVFYRGIIPFFCLLITLLLFYKKNFFNTFYALGFVGLLNAFLIAFGNFTFIASIESTNVANTLIMISLAPFTAAFLSLIFLGENPKIRTWLAMIICFFLILFIFFDSYESNRLIGDLFGFATAFFIGGSAVAIRYGKKNNFLPSLLLAKLITSIIAIFFVTSFNLQGVDIILILTMGIFFVFIPISLITLAPRYIPAYDVELFFLLEAVLGPIWVWIFIKEQPSLDAIIGGICIIFVIFIHTLLEINEKKSY